MRGRARRGRAAGDVDPRRVAAARRRLREIVAGIDAGVREALPRRCPHRTRADRCAYPGACRNRIVSGGGHRCSGAPLSAGPGREGGGRSAAPAGRAGPEGDVEDEVREEAAG